MSDVTERVAPPPQGYFMPETSPYVKLAQGIADLVLQSVLTHGAFFEREWERHYASPIEAIFSCALFHASRHYDTGVTINLLYVGADKTPEEYEDGRSYGTVAVQKQAQLEGWRVDFLLSQYAEHLASASLGRQDGWRRLIVECDGHNFHERTKEQAAKDRSRDRAFQARGIDVFRFTGSELWGDPLKCAVEVIQWVQKGL